MTIYDKSDEIHAGKKHVSNTQTKPSKVSFFFRCCFKKSTLQRYNHLNQSYNTGRGISRVQSSLKRIRFRGLTANAGTQKRRAVFLRHALLCFFIMLQKLFYGIRHSIRFIAFCHILCHFFNLRFRIFHCNRRFEVHRKH